MALFAGEPMIPIERVMDLGAVVAARDSLSVRPPWPGLFIKAYALVAREFPQLRQVYLSYPWPHLFEYEESVASIAIARSYLGEPVVFGYPIKEPASLSVVEIGRRVKHAANDPIEEIRVFGRYLRMGRLPIFIRRPLWRLLFNIPRQRGNLVGTFGISAVSSLGADLTVTVSMWTTLLGYGVMASDGTLAVHIVFDHRVLDGATAAMALARLEEILNGPIVDELQREAQAEKNSAAR